MGLRRVPIAEVVVRMHVHYWEPSGVQSTVNTIIIFRKHFMAHKTRSVQPYLFSTRAKYGAQSWGHQNKSLMTTAVAQGTGVPQIHGQPQCTVIFYFIIFLSFYYSCPNFPPLVFPAPPTPTPTIPQSVPTLLSMSTGHLYLFFN